MSYTTHTHSSTASCEHPQTHTMYKSPTFQPLSSVFVPFSTPFIAVKGLFQKGSFQVLSHSFKCKWTSKSPQKLNLHLFPSSEGFSLPSTIWLTAESNQIRAGTRRWFPDKCPCHFPLQTWDNSWKVLGWPLRLFIIRKQGCGDSQPASQGAQESTQTHNIVTLHKSNLLHSKWLLSIILIDFKIKSKENNLQMSPVFLQPLHRVPCVACNSVSVMSLGCIPSSRLSKPNWRLKRIFNGIPPFKSLL